MRAAFSDALVRIARADPRVVLLTGDHGYSLFDAFRSECAAQYINAGVAEQNMVGMAGGLARAGFRPFVYGLSAFIPVRVLEQIKLDIAHDNLPVVLIGDGAGFVYSHLGTSHQATEDIACTRAIPQLAVFSPADRFELSLCMQLAYDLLKPVYLRMGKADLGDVHSGPSLRAREGQFFELRRGQAGRLAMIATGSLVRTAIDLADTSFTDSSVWSAPFLKPADVSQIAEICANSVALVTLEEHSVYGGLGSLVAEISSATHPRKILRIGVRDRFSALCGSYQYLLTEHGLDIASVRQQITDFVGSLNAQSSNRVVVHEAMCAEPTVP
jgi:transketolase